MRVSVKDLYFLHALRALISLAESILDETHYLKDRESERPNEEFRKQLYTLHIFYESCPREMTSNFCASTEFRNGMQSMQNSSSFSLIRML